MLSLFYESDLLQISLVHFLLIIPSVKSKNTKKLTTSPPILGNFQLELRSEFVFFQLGVLSRTGVEAIRLEIIISNMMEEEGSLERTTPVEGHSPTNKLLTTKLVGYSSLLSSFLAGSGYPLPPPHGSTTHREIFLKREFLIFRGI